MWYGINTDDRLHCGPSIVEKSSFTPLQVMLNIKYTNKAYQAREWVAKYISGSVHVTQHSIEEETNHIFELYDFIKIEPSVQWDTMQTAEEDCSATRPRTRTRVLFVPELWMLEEACNTTWNNRTYACNEPFKEGIDCKYIRYFLGCNTIMLLHPTMKNSQVCGNSQMGLT